MIEKCRPASTLAKKIKTGLLDLAVCRPTTKQTILDKTVANGGPGQRGVVSLDLAHGARCKRPRRLRHSHAERYISRLERGPGGYSGLRSILQLSLRARREGVKAKLVGRRKSDNHI